MDRGSLAQALELLQPLVNQGGVVGREAKDLIGQGYIGGGMLPKLNNCIDAIENGVSRVHILDGRILHCLLLEIFTNKGIGTAILGEGEGKYYHEEQ